tara:strand:- start:313 stop:510 length:198 start_codon:yes stop_codon:yes gene_type:complete
MKIGDLVSLKSGYSYETADKDIYYRSGVIIMIDEYDTSGLWYQVQWGQESLWHRAGDLELVNESG